MSAAEKPEKQQGEPAPLAAKEQKPKAKRKRKYAWMRPPVADDSEDEGNELDDWEEERFRELCLCEPRPYSTAQCNCGCLVFYTRRAWRQHKKKHGIAPPGGWGKWS